MKENKLTLDEFYNHYYLKDRRLLLLEKLITVNVEYQKSNNDRKIKLFEACSHIFDQLENLGVPRPVSEAVAVFGEEFIRFEFGKSLAGYIQSL